MNSDGLFYDDPPEPEAEPAPRRSKFGRRAAPELEVITGDSIVGEDEDWVAYPVLAVGSETLFFGRKGLGKSQLSEEMAARITTGRPMPWEPAETKHDPASVVILSCEDDPTKNSGRVLSPWVRT